MQSSNTKKLCFVEGRRTQFVRAHRCAARKLDEVRLCGVRRSHGRREEAGAPRL